MPMWDMYGYGKGKGKGKSILKRTPNEKLVWIGGLPEAAKSKDLNKALQEHLNTSGGCKFVDIGKKGQGGAAFGTPEEATACISKLNGSTFQGSKLELDVWTKKEKA